MSFPRPLRAIVTGAGSGLGRALAQELAGRGGQLLVSDVDSVGLDQTASLLSERGTRVETLICDVADRDAVFGLVEEATSRLGGIDLMVNNAGVAVGGAFAEVSNEDWRWAMDINLWGVIHGCQAAAPRMLAQGRGYILNVASAAGLLSPPSMAPYNVTKAGVVALSETLYAEYKDAGLRVSVLCPTFFTTKIADSGRGAWREEDKQRVRRWMARSKVQAPEVARVAIDAVRDGKLYVQPMRDGRMAWRLKRLRPQRFYDALASTQRKRKR